MLHIILMSISCFMIFANYYLLTICILDYGNDIRQKGNLNGFLEFKMDHKAAETTCSINNTFGPGTASECTVQHDSRSFAKEMRVWKVRSIVAGHWKLITTN